MLATCARRLLLAPVALALASTSVAQFGAPRSLTQTDSGQIDPTLVDLDGDGDLDAVTASDEHMAWHRNDGGVLGAPTTFGGPAYWTSGLAAADLDGDGAIDVVRISRSVGVQWMRNLGGGQFSAPVTIDDSILPWDVTAVDLDQDGDADLVLAIGGLARLGVIENLGGGTFGSVALQSQSAYDPRSISTGDVDGDGMPDLVYASYNDERVDWLRNLGGLGFGSPQTVGQGIRWIFDIELEDMDDDGDLEIVAAAGGSNRIVWFENLSGGAFGPEQLLSPRPGPYGIEFVDVDGDQDRDLVASFTTPGLGWLERTGVGTYLFPRSIVAQSGGAGLSIGDIDGDGLVDVLAMTTFDALAWYPGATSTNRFGPPHHLRDEVQVARDVIARDLDGDGDQDVVAASERDDQIASFENLGNGAFGPMSRIERDCDECHLIRAEDVDQDGIVDLVYASAAAREVYLRRGNGGSYEPRETILSLGTQAYGLELVDLDGDLDRDLVVLDTRVHVLENANGTFTPRALIGGLNFPRALEVGDVDGDGRVDLVALSRNDLSIMGSLNLGAFSFGPMTDLCPSGPIPLDFDMGDPDGDGDLDIVTVGTWTNDWIRLFSNDGNGVFSGPLLVDQTGTNTDREHVRFADLDGDGDDDIVLHLSDTGTDGGVYWYEAMGTGFGPQALVVTTGPFGDVTAGTEGDMDGDGDLDILFADRSRELSWTSSDLRSTIGFDSCGPGQLNSTGRSGVLFMSGSEVASDNALTLHVREVPAQQFGMFVTAMASTQPTAIPGSMGMLCLGGVLGRIQGPGQIVQTSRAGTAQLNVGTSALPLGGQSRQATAGETWTFQFWHRDMAPVPTSNLTSARTLTFH